MDEKPREGANRDTFGYYDTSVTWKDLPWIMEHTKGLPLYIKGVATVEVRFVELFLPLGGRLTILCRTSSSRGSMGRRELS